MATINEIIIGRAVPKKPDTFRTPEEYKVVSATHAKIFRNEEGLKKVAMLVKTFIDLGGHQIQLNAVNRDILLDAQKHPEKYTNLIVRVWGWSGYFVELDSKYQDHIISRLEYTV